MRTTTDLTRALCQARQQTDELFRLVRPEALYERPIAERHRMLFYIGHLEAFDWNLIGRYALDAASFHPTFDRLFAFGIDPPPGQLPSDQPSDWPGLDEMERYNRRARDEIDGLLHTEALSEKVPEQLLHVAIEHRLMHAETFAYILHQVDYADKLAQPSWPVEARPPAPEILEIPAGTAQLGMKNGGFGWDNEFQAHHVEVPAFSIGKYKVTNGEYLEFVRQGAEAPFFWKKCGGDWHYRGMWAEFPLPLEWPVYVTYDEAEAYAQWRGMRLPSEAEWHRAAARSPVSCNVDFRYWDPTPVTADDAANQAARAGGEVSQMTGGEVSQMTGNGWEWTSSQFAPFPGFAPFPFYANYSAPFFDGQHYVLKGASPRTAACFLRPSFRNWFRPSYPYLYATMRLVES
jgi:formylglycine-generating enzyme required for sulfatase activity